MHCMLRKKKKKIWQASCGTEAKQRLVWCVLSGCSAAKKTDAVTITYQTMEALPQQREALNRLVEEFHRGHPNIRVKIQMSPSGFQKLQAQLASGNLPDVFYYVTDRLPLLVHRKAVLDLRPFLAMDPSVDLSGYYEKTVESCTIEGGMYCFPFHFSTDILFYNKSLFDRARLSYPTGDWHWEDFVRAAKSLTIVEDGKTVQYGALQPRPVLLIKSFGGACFENGRCVIDGPPARAAIDFLGLLTRDGLAPQTAALRDIEVMDGVSLFSTGKIGMLLGRTYMLVEFGKLRDFEWDVALVPRGQRRYSRLAVGGNCISSKTAHPKEAWEFVKFFCGPRGSQIMGSFRNCVPAYRAAAHSETFLHPPPPGVQIFLDALETAEIENPGMIGWQEYLDKVIQPNVDAVLFGNISTDEALRDMQKEGERFLKDEAFQKQK